MSKRSKMMTMMTMGTKKNDTAPFWSVKAEDDGAGQSIGHVYLYEPISGMAWWDDELTPKTFRKDLRSLGDVDEIRVHIFCHGGDVAAANAMIDIMQQHPAKTVAYGEGLIASAATVIAAGCDEYYISPRAESLYHMPAVDWMSDRMTPHNLRKQADLLDKCAYTMIITYMQQTGMSKEEITAILEGDDGDGSWFTADEVVELGFADGYIPDDSDEALGAVACIGRDMYAWNGHEYDLSIYDNAPKLVSGRRKFDMSKLNGSAFAAQANNVGTAVPAVNAQTAPADPAVPATATPAVQAASAEPAAAPAVTPSPAAADTDAINAAVQAALQADRERTGKIDSLKQLYPAHAQIIEDAKVGGLSYETAAAAVLDAEMSARAAGTAAEGGAAAAFIAGIEKAGEATAQVGAAPAPQEGASKQEQAAAGIAAFWKK